MHKEITRQYQASLKMLMDVIEKCPDSIWANEEYENAYWRIVYHALFYTTLYLSANPVEYVPYPHHIENYNLLGTHTKDHQPIHIERIYLKDEMMEYTVAVFNSIESWVNRFPMEDSSGFDWIPLNRFELHLYNIRHLQHHTGQLIERLHQTGIKGIKWEGR